MDRNSPIGVFDSGVGGLTVAREIMRQMPEERIIYLEIRPVCPTAANPRTRFCAIPGRSFGFS